MNGDTEEGSGLLSGFESTGGDGGGILPSPIAIGHSPEGPDCILPLVSTAGNLQKNGIRFGLLAWDCATEHADTFPPLQPPGRAGLEPGTFHAWDGVDGRDWP